MKKERVLIWFSCGATSAVAAKLALKKYKDHDCHVLYCDTNSEHPDNKRFFKDIEKWINHPIKVLKSAKYTDIWEVFEKTRYLVGVAGARCTGELKKVLRRDYEEIGDIQIFGFDLGEKKRIADFRENNPEVNLNPILIENNLSKEDCLAMLEMNGIELPITYKMGYKNANCIGCVKGQSGYWNKIRVDFPEVFERMSKVERKLNVAINKRYEGKERIKVFLDELDPEAGNYSMEPNFECSLFCSAALNDL